MLHPDKLKYSRMVFSSMQISAMAGMAENLTSILILLVRSLTTTEIISALSSPPAISILFRQQGNILIKGVFAILFSYCILF